MIEKLFSFLTLMLLISPFASAEDLFHRDLFQGEIDYSRSVYIRQDPAFPLGTERPYRLLKELVDMGAKHLTLEIRVVLESTQDNRVNWGFYRGSTKEQLRGFVAAAHIFGLTITLKPVLTLRDGTTQVVSEAKDIDVFGSTYGSFVSYLSKIAKASDADEVVLGTGLSNIICQRPQILELLIKRTNTPPPHYQLRLRLDFVNPREAQKVKECVLHSKSTKDVLKQIDAFGIDLPVNPQSDLALKYLNEGFILSRVEFNGSPLDQAKKALAFYDNIGQSQSKSQAPISFGTYDTNPWLQGALDESHSPRGKPLESSLRTWFSK